MFRPEAELPKVPVPVPLPVIPTVLLYFALRGMPELREVYDAACHLVGDYRAPLRGKSQGARFDGAVRSIQERDGSRDPDLQNLPNIRMLLPDHIVWTWHFQPEAGDRSANTEE